MINLSETLSSEALADIYRDKDPFWNVAFEKYSPEYDVTTMKGLRQTDLKITGRSGCSSCYSTEHRFQHAKEWVRKITIKVIEQRSEGILDLIGGEAWEASFLLSAYILKNPEIFINRTVLELGSGVGIPSVLLTYLNRLNLNEKSDTHIILTDYENTLLENLSASLSSQFEDLKEEGFPSVNVLVHHLDWLHEDADLPFHGRVDVIIGSALIYQPDHAVVAEIIRYY
jgi:predicted nicotinamide N-methyase